jgi:hypothetical protein
MVTIGEEEGEEGEGRMASRMSAPNMLRMETVRLPVLYTSRTICMQFAGALHLIFLGPRGNSSPDLPDPSRWA